MGKTRDSPFVGHPHLKNSTIMTRADDIPPKEKPHKADSWHFFQKQVSIVGGVLDRFFFQMPED